MAVFRRRPVPIPPRADQDGATLYLKPLEQRAIESSARPGAGIDHDAREIGQPFERQLREVRPIGGGGGDDDDMVKGMRLEDALGLIGELRAQNAALQA